MAEAEVIEMLLTRGAMRSLSVRQDAQFAMSGKSNGVFTLLVGPGINDWFSPHLILGSEVWVAEFGKALQRCDWFLVVLSPAAVKSMWVEREVNYAVIEKRLRNRIVPVVWRPCEAEALSWVLPQLQRVELGRDFARGCAELLRIWKKRPKAAVMRSLLRP
jgi:hypothetical protein